MNAFLMQHPELGIYLGSCMGLGFWSKLDAAGQTEAVTFPSPEAGIAAIKSWQDQGNSQLKPEDMKFLPVIAAEEGYATMQQCVKAGARPW